LGVRLQLLGYKEHLNVHLQFLLKFAGSVLFIIHQIRCKLTKPQKLYNVLIHRSVHCCSLMNCPSISFWVVIRKKYFCRNSSRTGPKIWASLVSLIQLATRFQPHLSENLRHFHWYSLGILVVFRRSVVSISYCSASKGFSVPEKMAGCSLLNLETFLGLCSWGAVNNPWRRSSIFSY